MNTIHYNFFWKILALSLLFILIAFAFCFFGCFLSYESNTIEAAESIDPIVTVILDAGHGGIDAGASIGETLEKDINLQIVNKISSYLSFYNLRVVLTRNNDCLLADESSKNKKRDDLSNRMKIANSYEDQIFVSIHANKFPDTKYKGLQVFYSENDSHSEALAILVQNNNKEYLESDNNRNIKKSTSSIYLLDRLNCPAVLIECGFLSNSDDLVKLTDEVYQDELAFVIANSIIEYINL